MLRLLLALVALVSAGFVWWSGQMLPAQVASRFDSQGMADFAYKIMSAQRKEFGGHDEKSS